MPFVTEICKVKMTMGTLLQTLPYSHVGAATSILETHFRKYVVVKSGRLIVLGHCLQNLHQERFFLILCHPYGVV